MVKKLKFNMRNSVAIRKQILKILKYENFYSNKTK